MSILVIIKELLFIYYLFIVKLPWRLYADTPLVCFSDHHLDYLYGASFALFCYYPITTFFYPNFVFQNTVIMLKYEASWIILNNSVKFIIVGTKKNNYKYQIISIYLFKGLTSFFKTYDGITISLSLSFILLFFLATVYTIYEVKKIYNISI